MKKTTILTGIIIALAAAVSIHLSTYPATLAQVPGDSTTATDCLTGMRPFIDQKNKEFREYLQANFQNKSTNSSLLDLALKRFELYKNDLMNKYMTYPFQPGFSLAAEVTGSLSCYQQMQTEIALSEALLKEYFTTTSNLKTSSALMQKLKTINKQLDQLAVAVAQMYGKYETFNNKIPCIIEKCI